MKSPDQFQRHNKIIGKIFIVLAVLHLLASSFLYNAIYFFESWEIFEKVEIGIFTFRHPISFFYAFPLFYGVLAVAEFILAAGVLGNQRWAQKLAMFPAVFYFLNFPIGTAFSIYIFLTFWEMPHSTESKGNSVQGA